MPNVTTSPRSNSNGEQVTEFLDTVSTTPATYTFPNTQNRLKIKNNGFGSLSLTVNGLTVTMLPRESKEFYGSIDSFVIASNGGVQSFEVLGTYHKEEEFQLDSLKRNGGYGYNVDEGLRKWRTSISNPLLNVLLIGDSITEGYNATDIATQGYAALIRSELQTRFGNAGIGFIPLWKTTWALTGTWTPFTDYGPSACCKYATGTGNTATITGLYGDNFDIYVMEAADSGAFTVSIDGGAT